MKPFIGPQKLPVFLPFWFLFVAAYLMASLCGFGEVPSAIAIENAHVITGRGADLQRATVLLRNGMIEDVGSNVAIPR